MNQPAHLPVCRDQAMARPAITRPATTRPALALDGTAAWFPGPAPQPAPGAMGTDLLLKRWCRQSRTWRIAAALRRPYLRLKDEEGRALQCQPCGQGWQQLHLTAPGTALGLGGLCTFADAASRAAAAASHAACANDRWLIALPGGPMVEGRFCITGFSRLGRCDGAAVFLFELGSRSQLRFGAA